MLKKMHWYKKLTRLLIVICQKGSNITTEALLSTNITRKDYFSLRIFYPSISKLWMEGKYEPIVVCNKYVITSGTVKSLYSETLLK